MLNLQTGLILLIASGAGLFAQQEARLKILLPERTRLLVRQRIDLVVEARNVEASKPLLVIANGHDISNRFAAPVSKELDCNGSKGLVYRADLFEFQQAGMVKLSVELQTPNGPLRANRTVEVRPFTLPSTPRNYTLFVGDAMGNAYRDAGRIVGRSVETKPGVPGMREGFFDRLQEMDQMPVSGFVMTYGFAALVPDSAETASHWSTGNKPLTGMLSAFPDGTELPLAPATEYRRTRRRS